MTAPADVSRYLHPGERLLWSGQPDPSVRFGPSDGYLVPFSILWCGFAILWEAVAIRAGAPLLFKLWGLPFVALGLYITIGQFAFRRRRALRTVYVLTDHRAIVAQGERSYIEGEVKQQPVRVQRSRDGRHVSVTFGLDNYSRGWGQGPGQFYVHGMNGFNRPAGMSLAFYNVADPERLLSALALVTRP